MKIEDFILNILKKIEEIDEGSIAYAYKTGNAPMTEVYWEISVSNSYFYMNNKRFKTLTKAWYKSARARGEKIIFVCGWKPSEEKLVKLADENNLILNV